MKITKTQLKKIIKEEMSNVLSENPWRDSNDPLNDEQDIFPVTRALEEWNLDKFEAALLKVIKKLVPNASPYGLSQISRNAGEHQANLSSAVNRSHSVASAGREFITDLAAMVAKL